MTRRMIPTLTIAAALLVLAGLLVWFFPQNTLSVLTSRRGGETFRALTISADGQYQSCSASSVGELVAVLSDSSCVPLPGLRAKPSSGDICLFYDGMCAVVSPNGAYLYQTGRGRASYIVMGGGPELYLRVRGFIAPQTQEAV